ncbi:uncharacterized protein [Gossypium hirsutum]|uniref:G-patch domain-containing protein n=1 Tax=Gossypium hirsutum TaxID=3635 RepID=A0A1U8PEA8_GOSHI|nr:uncharacterized protein LOC107958308 [Gossypium hirsutum]
MAGGMIENAVRGGKIEGEVAKRSTPRRKDNEPPYPKWYDANAKCEYHAGISGHSIENYTGFKKVVERLIKMGVVKFDSTPNTENSLPDHGNQGVNAIDKIKKGNVKEDIAEVKTPMKVIWEEMMKREFKAMVQGLMVNKELQVSEGSSCERQICVLENERQETHRLRIIISLPGNNEAMSQTGPKIVIHKPNPFPYNDDRSVPWSYDCNITIPEGESIASAARGAQNKGSHTRSGKRYDRGNIRVEPAKTKDVEVEREKETEVSINEPVKEEEAKEFLKFLKHSEYNMVEQLRKQPARISVLALLLSSEVHRDALLKLDRLVNNINADNFIYFNGDEIPPGGIGSTKALHITTRCKGYTLSSVLVDNGSALNVLPLSTLNRLPIDSSHMKTCHNVVRAFDGTERKVMGRIDIPLEIGANTYEVDFLLVIDGRLITINAEEDIIAVVTSRVPYVEANEEAIEFSFRSLEVINSTFILERSEVPVPKMSRATRMALQMMMGKGALPGKGLGRQLQGGVQIPKLFEKKDRFGLGFRLDHKHKRQEIEKHQVRRNTSLNGREVEWEPMTFSPISKSFKSGGLLVEESHQINAVHNKGWEQGNLKGICPYESGSSLNNWTAEDLPVVFRNFSESLDINDLSADTTAPNFSSEQDTCLEEPQDFEDVQDCDVSLDLLRMRINLRSKFDVPVFGGEQIEDIDMTVKKIEDYDRSNLVFL